MKRHVRSHHCGELTSENIEKKVMLCGWVSKRRDHGGVIFIDLRDRYGLTQVVFDPAYPNGEKVHAIAEDTRSEYVLWCSGTVRPRPDGMINKNLKTGEIEVVCDDVAILSEAKTPPFALDEETDVSETVRLKYRYLDLRRPELQRNLRIRHEAITAVREHLNENGFLEVETPILYKSTPEGARDFIVPSRLNFGSFYALPQSPQTLKQLLMISGFDRYYQIARCFRDEDLRADRQPEFSQIDIELSFVDEEILFPLIEGMMARVWKNVLDLEIEAPFRRISYRECMDRFGVDRPDDRFGLELTDLTQIFKNSDFQVFKAAIVEGETPKKDSVQLTGGVRAIKVEGRAAQFSRKDLEDYQKELREFGAKGLLWIKVQSGGELQSPATKFFSKDEVSALKSQLNLKEGDLVLVVADPSPKVVFQSLGALRLKLAERLGEIERANSKPGAEKFSFLWVTDFPLVEYDEKEKRYFALHHPFSAPQPEYRDDFVRGENLSEVKAAAYDLVLNGAEIAGGSLRIYDNKVQQAMFKNLGITEEEARQKFGFFLEALEYGTPPHGGIAFGIERLTGMLAGVHAIRDVMAFPKTQKGHCLMSGCPSEVAPDQLAEVGVSLLKTKK